MKYFISFVLLSSVLRINAQTYNTDIQGTINTTGYYLNGQPFTVESQWYTSGTNIYNANSGNVGIGISTPSAKLDIESNTNASFRVKSSTAPNPAWMEVNASGITGAFESVFSPSTKVRIGSKTNYDFALFSYDTDRLTIKADGKIGIGISTPSYLFEVNGIAYANELRGPIAGAIRVNSGTGTLDMGAMNTGWAHMQTDRPKFYFNRGITVDEGFVSSYDEDLNLQTSGSTRLTISSASGNVGIGTPAPGQKLHVASTGSTYVSIDKGGDASEAGLTFNRAGSVLFYLFNDDASNALKIQATGQTGEADATPRMQFPFSNKNIYMAQSGGNVGIGTDLPNYKLDVNGPINASSLYVNGVLFTGNSQWVTSGSDIYYTVGKVGIGTSLSSNPNDYSLAVNGKIGSKDVQIESGSTTWPDYVFEPTYKLPLLSEVEEYIKAHKHLEGVPSAENVRKNGYSMSEFDAVLLRKMEEMTLYIIEQQKQIEELKKKLADR